MSPHAGQHLASGPDPGQPEELDVAVVGMSGRFPGAADLEQFWSNVRAGVESITFHGDDELRAAGVDPDLVAHPDYVGASAVLDGADSFDAGFFGYSPREAELLDPQQRLLLECAWAALESAGCDPTRYDGSIGVFTGTGLSTYLLFNLARATGRVSMTDDALTVMMGNDKGFASTRVAYHLGLGGPCMDVNSACSTSLVAVALAYQSLLTFQCDMALAGGAAVNLSQGPGYLYREGGPASPDGHCRAFDHRGRGTVFGSGLGLVVLKRLEDAIADGDTIRAVVKSAAVNNDGNRKVGYTAPSVPAQAEVVAQALAAGGVDARTIGYVEAHGTGTELGDPIEVAALTKAFRLTTADRGYCALGSVKANIGHLDAAAGVAGLIKAVLVLEHGEIPPTCGFEAPNPKLDLAGTPFHVNTTLRAWPRGDTPRRAGVSSFGFGGTNAHVVLQEAPPRPAGVRAERPSLPHLVMVSARSPAALDRATQRLAHHLATRPELDLADAAFTLQVGRRALEHRRVVLAGDPAGAVAALEAARETPAPRVPDSPSVVWLLPGQGAQHAGMGADLYEHVGVFRDVVDHCAGVLRPHLGLDLRDVLCARGAPDLAGNRTAPDIDRTVLTQPALFVTEYALASALLDHGVRPEAMIGHSVGEYVAATLAGVMGLEDALAVVAARGRLVQALPGGTMLAVDLPPADLRARLGQGVALAVVNGPSACVAGGPSAAVDTLERRLLAEGVSCRRLRVSHAFHTPMMAEASEGLRRAFEGIELRPPRVPYVSDVTGDWITPDEAVSPSYWARHLLEPVQFDRGLRTVLAAPGRVLVEVGPGQQLSTLTRHHPERSTAHHVVGLMPPHGDRAALPSFLTGLGALWCAGVGIDWSRLHDGHRRRRIPLPTYPFERERYWVEPDGDVAPDPGEAGYRGTEDWLYVPGWKRSLLAPSEGEEGRHWLLLGTDSALCTTLGARLTAAGGSVTVVRSGGTFAAEGDGFQVRPANAADWRAVLRDLDLRGTPPTGIVHLWCAEPAAAAGDGPTGLSGLLALGDALSGHDRDGDVVIAVVTCGAQPVSGEEALLPERAALLGACRVLPQEVAGVSCRSIDIEPGTGADGEVARTAGQVARELRSGDGAPAVAYRGRYRWVQVFERARPEPAPHRRLRSGGTYLVTGAFGRVATVLAEHLARTLRPRLALVARTALPERSSWEAWLAGHEPGDRVSERIRAVRRLEALGAEVLVASADVTDPGHVRRVIDLVRERFGRIDGVVHGIGITEEAAFMPLARCDPGAAEAIVRSRAAALPLLAEALADDDPDFCVLHSSLAAVLGGPGLAAYAASSCYVDAFAHHLHTAGRHGWVSIDWDAWQLDGASGRGATAAQARPLDAASAAALFERLAGVEALPQVVVSAADLDARVERWLVRAGQPAAGTAAAPPGLHPRPGLEIPYAAPRTPTEKQIVELWEDLLRVSPVGIDDHFFDLGGDSVLATQLLVRLRATLEVDVPLAVLFESPTVRTCASALAAGAATAPPPPIVPLPRTTRLDRGALSAPDAHRLRRSEEP